MGLSLGGALGGGAFGSLLNTGIGTTFGALGGSGALGNLFGTQQGTVPYNNSFNNTSTFNPFAASYLPAALTGAQQVYNSGGNGLFGAAQDQVRSTLNGDYLNPNTNPYFQSSVNDALGMARSSFAGQYGGAAGNNLGNSGYQEGLARTLGQVATNAYSNAYGQERQNQLGAVPYAASLPYANVAGYESALAPGLSFGTQTQSGTGQNEQPYFQNNTANTLGALAGGAGLFKMFSDRRLKSNIVKVGDHPKGFGVYEYDIFGQRQRGVMADEVEKIIPEAVSELAGYKVVDYGRL
jgi:hypothetical protein